MTDKFMACGRLWQWIQLHCWRRSLDTVDMNVLLLGLGFGILTVAMPGPISVSLVQVASQQGRSSGVRAAAGVAGADVILGAVAVLVVSAGAALPAGLFSLLQLLTALLLVGFGLVLLTRPAVVAEQAGAVSRPLLTFLTVTTLMPTAFGSWLAMLSAMPFASDRPALIAFTVGVIAVSAIWHPFLGFSAGAIGPRLTERVLRVGTQVGGLATLLLGLWAAFGG